MQRLDEPEPAAEAEDASPASWMRSTLKRWPLEQTLLFALTGLAVAIGVWVRASLLGSGSMWMDELWTVDAISRSFKEMIGARLVSDQSPPLWTMLSWGWLQLVGTYDTTSLRLLAAAFSCLAIGAPIVGAIRMPALRPTLLVMASLLAVSLFTVQYGVEFRTYSMMVGLGAVATVVWAGMLTGQLPRSGRWIFVFALTGALAGFGHYYGNILYGCELALLLAIFAFQRCWRPGLILLVWGVLSLLPVSAWYVLTSKWMPTGAVVGPPSLSVITSWLGYTFAPVTNQYSGEPLGYLDWWPADTTRLSVIAAGIAVAAILVAVVFYALPRRGRAPGLPPATAAGAGAVFVVVAGICAAWWVSIVKLPSMSVRHLSALLPALFLGIACACTLLPGRARWLTASIAVALVVALNGMFISDHGVASLTPPWQAQAGYRDAARAIVSASRGTPKPTLIGLNTGWAWHGQWDAVFRAELGSGPAVSSDPEPLPVRWIGSVQDIKPGEVPSAPLLAFADSDPADQRTADVFAWAKRTVGSCQQSTFGGPAYGIVVLLSCG